MIPELTDIALAGAFTLLASGWLTGLLLPLLLRLMNGCAPHPRTRLLMMSAATPVIVTFWVVFLLLNPQLAGVLFHDHCHGDVCGPHIPQIGASSLSGVILAALVTFAGLVVVLILSQRLQHQRLRLLAMQQLSSDITGPRYRLIDSPLPLAWCAGLWHPQIYLSSGLLQQLDADEVRLVMLHESCHVWRRDNLRKQILHWATLLWLPASRRRLYEAYSLATEQLCDRYACQQGYRPADVSRVLNRLSHSASEQPCSSRRAEQLSGPERSSADGWLLLALLLAAQVGLFTHYVHPLLDSLFL
ncbi:MAG: M56 family metallopeptidase [Pseudomonadota bacterium]|nr:M56 family metallopeptidase [Pseudomonadota bacterium]